MKKISILLIVVFTSLLVMAQPPEGPAKKGMIFGSKTTTEGAVDINTVAAKVTSTQATDVKLKGKVVEVCKEMGCWLKMETGNGKMMIKMKDHAFFVPVDLVGKEVVIDGTAKMTITPVGELKHYAEDAKKSKEEIAAIKEPKKEIVMDAKGILVL
jgi:RNase P/RNase MRP subunit p29